MWPRLSHIVIVSGMHSPTIFRCLEIIMITSLLPHDECGDRATLIDEVDT